VGAVKKKRTKKRKKDLPLHFPPCVCFSCVEVSLLYPDGFL